MNPIIPQKIYYEESALQHQLGRQLLSRYQALDIPTEVIANHNNIESLRTRPNSSFREMKRYLIIGTRKTHKYVENHKVSDFLVPYTSSGCTAMCLYCYLVCSYNKCSYLRLFVNREEMMAKLTKKAASLETDTVFEIGSNSDLILENTMTGNLPWTIEEFVRQPYGKLTFPTKFSMVEPILSLDHQNRMIVRVSINPDYIINKVEFGTSNLTDRIQAVNRLCEAGYPVGIILAPVILLENWKHLYTELFEQLSALLSENAKKSVFFEVIFMTYSFIHDKINAEAFPGAIDIFDRSKMTGRGRGKYWYKEPDRNEGKAFLQEKFDHYFKNNRLLYMI